MTGGLPSSARSRPPASSRRSARSRASRTPTRCCATAPTSPTSASGWRSRTRPRSRAARSSASSRTRRACATSSCRARSRAREQARLEELAKEWGAKGLANLDADLEVPLRARARGLRRRGGLDGALRRRRGAGRRARPRAAAAAPRARARPDRREASTSSTGSLDFPLFEHSEEFGGWTFMHHPFTAPCAERGGADRGGSRARARPALRPDLERLGARLRLDPDPRGRGAAGRLPRDGHRARRSSATSSASCSTRCRWARRRTAASRWGSTASSPCSRASPTSGR